MNEIKIKAAQGEDHQTLSELTKLSKAYWGYSEELMQTWDEELTLSEEYIKSYTVFKLEQNSTILGYYAYRALDAKKIKLDNLFIHPEGIRQGWGKMLMQHLFAQAQSESFSHIIVDADPNVELFYEKFGFKTIDKLSTAVPGRYLPVMEKYLEKNH